MKSDWWEEREEIVTELCKWTSVPKGTYSYKDSIANNTIDLCKQQRDKELREILEIIEKNIDEDNVMLNYKNKVLINLKGKIKEMIK